MSDEKEQVRKFYEIIWNQRNKLSIPDVLAEDVVFRGSLGDEKTGHSGFIEYLDSVHNSLGDYHCHIEEIVADDDKVFTKMVFRGIHQGVLMGVEPTGKSVSWHGAALFRFVDGKIASLWVLGDLVSLRAQLQVP